ncbi:TPA: glycosyltransferase, partial [Escherichia coli]
MKNEPLISILIPTYNVGAWIDEAIKSIIEQTYKKIEI